MRKLLAAVALLLVFLPLSTGGRVFAGRRAPGRIRADRTRLRV